MEKNTRIPISCSLCDRKSHCHTYCVFNQGNFLLRVPKQCFETVDEAGGLEKFAKRKLTYKIVHCRDMVDF